MKLFKTEFLLFIKSMTFVGFLIAALAFYYTQYQEITSNQIATATTVNGQYYSGNYFMRPVRGSQDYGQTKTINKKSIIQNGLLSLQSDYRRNSFATYPFMFEKIVHLNNNQKIKVSRQFKTLTNRNIETGSLTEYAADKLAQRISYKQFQRDMGNVDAIVGGHSYYAAAALQGNFNTGEKLTYREALKNYQQNMRVDRLSNAMARLFCDYFGIILIIFSVFPLVIYFSKERLERCQDILEVKSMATWKYLVVKYVIAVFGMYVVVQLFAIYPALQAQHLGGLLNVNVDPLGFQKQIDVMLLPTILYITALTLLLAQFLRPIITLSLSLANGIFLLATTDINGLSTWSPLMRFNDNGNWRLFKQLEPAIYQNRMGYLFVSLVLVGLAIWLRSERRRWRWG